ncbi:GNAT family N-acetyltransferase [Streptomyces acidiscabies]|uniref:GNAT family N-acetyltransferase n=1 Tax=Streptomyces acidiscabies TaxID=42234 RepID=UPI00073EB2EF|nr:GNAT family N-acetyltransferase [Streptomyces acidiscabies]GAQ50590.1 putative acetyltransferase [Streptomyces acidiscabies]
MTDPLSRRPATVADVPVVHRLIAACEESLHGEVTTSADRVAVEFGEPGSEAVVVLGPEGEAAGWGWVRGRRATVDVHPRYRGRGLGGSLLSWAEARATGDRLAQSVPHSDLAAITLLESRGYAPLVTEWLLEIATDVEPEVPAPVAGVMVRAFRDGDERAAYQVVEDAFDEWQQRRMPYEEWVRHTVGREAFVAGASPVAFAGEEMVGAVLSTDGAEGRIQRVAVRRDQRGRGIARLLLLEAFRAFHRQGRRACTLWTHSDTGALALYERVGMTVRRSSTVYSKVLTVTR